jgi:hypothetical protein
MKCNLPQADKEHLLSGEKYKALLMFQYKPQDEWLERTINRYFNERTWRLFNVGKEIGSGTKFCKICRYALAADFGIAALTPPNHNVFQEVGLMQGLQKQVMYLVNPSRLSRTKLPFDVDDQVYIEHTNEKGLAKEFEKHIPLVIDKIKLLAGWESDQRKLVSTKLARLRLDTIELLKRLAMDDSIKFAYDKVGGCIYPDDWVKSKIMTPESWKELLRETFIVTEIQSGGSKTIEFMRLNNSYLPHLRELLWREPYSQIPYSEK